MKPFKRTRGFYLVFIAVGAALVAFGALGGILWSEYMVTSFLTGFCVGGGGTVLVFGALRLYYLKYKPELARRQNVYNKDERMKSIRDKAGLFACWTTVGTLLAATAALLWLELQTAAHVTLAILFVHLTGFVAATVYFDKKL
jgi:hypothetical protein